MLCEFNFLLIFENLLNYRALDETANLFESSNYSVDLKNIYFYKAICFTGLYPVKKSRLYIKSALELFLEIHNDST